MISVLLGGSLALSTIYFATNYQTKEVRKINDVFRNINYRAGKISPRLVETRKRDCYTEYIYEVPPGLIDDPKLLEVLPKTLRKPVSVKFNGVLILRVYNSELPSLINYDWQVTSGWTLPIGYTLDGIIVHDFDKIPHMTVSGATRQGKSVLLKLILAHLINSHPDHAEFYILDLKGGIEFGKYRRLKQVKSFADSVKSAESVLKSILKRLEYDMTCFAKNGYTDVKNTNIRRRIFIITDEAAELADSKPCREALSEICRLGGALGYRNIFATQYPTADTLPRQVKQNSDAKISFRLPTELASRVAIDEQGAEKLMMPGRAIYRTHERHIIHVPFVSDSDITKKLSEYFIEKEVDLNAETAKAKNSAAGTDIIDISGFNLRD